MEAGFTRQRKRPERGEGAPCGGFRCTSECAAALQRPPGLDGAAEGELVRVLEVAAHGQAARQATHRHAQRLDGARKVARRGLPLDVGVGGDDDLLDVLLAKAREQLANAQLLGTDLVHGADHAAEHMVQAVVGTRALDGLHVARLAHHADAGAVAHAVHADGALVGRSVVEAAAAEVHVFLYVEDGLGQTARLLGIGFEQVVGDALRALGANARQTAQLIEQPLKILVAGHASLSRSIQTERARARRPQAPTVTSNKR